MNEELSREEYKPLVEKAPIMIWRSNLMTECDYFNEIRLAFTGRSMGQEIGNGWAEGVHPEDFDRCLEIDTGHFARREVFEMEYRLRRYDRAAHPSSGWKPPDGAVHRIPTTVGQQFRLKSGAVAAKIAGNGSER